MNQIFMRSCCLIVIHIVFRLSQFIPRSNMSRDVRLLFSTLYSTEMSAFSLPRLYCIERFEETKQKTKPSSEKVNQKLISRHDQ